MFPAVGRGQSVNVFFLFVSFCPQVSFIDAKKSLNLNIFLKQFKWCKFFLSVSLSQMSLICL